MNNRKLTTDINVADFYPSGLISKDAVDVALHNVSIAVAKYSEMFTPKSEIQSCMDIIEKVIFNDPATIVFWSDGTKTVVKVADGEKFDSEKGLAMAISKHFFGDHGYYYDIFKKWLPKDQEQ